MKESWVTDWQEGIEEEKSVVQTLQEKYNFNIKQRKMYKNCIKSIKNCDIIFVVKISSIFKCSYFNTPVSV